MDWVASESFARTSNYASESKPQAAGRGIDLARLNCKQEIGDARYGNTKAYPAFPSRPQATKSAERPGKAAGHSTPQQDSLQGL